MDRSENLGDVGAVERKPRFHVEGQTSTVGPRWFIWDGERHFARFGNIASEESANAICHEMNKLSAALASRPTEAPVAREYGCGHSSLAPDAPTTVDATEAPEADRLARLEAAFGLVRKHLVQCRTDADRGSLEHMSHHAAVQVIAAALKEPTDATD